jgi:hypothetical protein
MKREIGVNDKPISWKLDGYAITSSTLDLLSAAGPKLPQLSEPEWSVFVEARCFFQRKSALGFGCESLLIGESVAKMNWRGRSRVFVVKIRHVDHHRGVASVRIGHPVISVVTRGMGSLKVERRRERRSGMGVLSCGSFGFGQNRQKFSVLVFIYPGIRFINF